MALKTGLTKREAIKELENLFSWAQLYFDSWNTEKGEEIQELIEEHKQYYKL